MSLEAKSLIDRTSWLSTNNYGIRSKLNHRYLSLGKISSQLKLAMSKITPNKKNTVEISRNKPKSIKTGTKQVIINKAQLTKATKLSQKDNYNLSSNNNRLRVYEDLKEKKKLESQKEGKYRLILIAYPDSNLVKVAYYISMQAKRLKNVCLEIIYIDYHPGPTDWRLVSDLAREEAKEIANKHLDEILNVFNTHSKQIPVVGYNMGLNASSFEKLLKAKRGFINLIYVGLPKKQTALEANIITLVNKIGAKLGMIVTIIPETTKYKELDKVLKL